MLTGLQPEVKEILQRSGLLDKIGNDNCFDTTTQAIYAIHPHLPILETETKELSEV
jgi:SulP family sulfate permease